MSKIIGIDLGTTNSCVAVMEGGEAVVIPNSEGARTTPSVVGVSKNGDRLIGQVAKRQAVTNYDNTVISIKRHMGSDYKAHMGGKDYTPQEISAMILQKLKADAEAYLCDKVTEAVITVPAFFTDAQRQATKDAGQIAGLTVKRIINEPTAAALSYGIDKEEDQKVMVYDLGGGTFDVSILDISSGVIEVLATAGNNHLGGDDFDQCIVDYLVSEFKKQTKIDLTRDPAAMQRVREAAEKAKIELSSMTQTTVEQPYIAVGKQGPLHMEIPLTPAKFNDLTYHLVQATREPVNQAINDSGVSISRISKVLMVGGSSRIPAVQDLVQSMTGSLPFKGINPDECVAMGACLQAGVLSGSVKGLLLLDVTPLSLGIETLGGVCTRIIERNTTLPIRKSQIFTTARPMQTSVEINVLQGERHFARDNKSLGKFKLTGIRSGFSSKPQIEVTFDIDVNGVVKVSAKDLGTGREQNITITGSTNLSENEIQRAMADAAAYEEEDTRRRERLELHNQAEMLAYKVDEALSKCKKELDKDEKNRVRNDLASLRRCLRKDKPEKMNETEEANLRQTKSQLEASANHLMVLYSTEQDAGRQ